MPFSVTVIEFVVASLHQFPVPVFPSIVKVFVPSPLSVTIIVRLLVQLGVSAVCTNKTAVSGRVQG